MLKKGEMSIQVVVAIAIGVLIFIFLIAMVSRGFSGWGKAVNDCDPPKRKCINNNANINVNLIPYPLGTDSCPNPGSQSCYECRPGLSGSDCQRALNS